MSIKELKLSSQIRMGFVVMFAFLILVGGISIYQNYRLGKQIALLYDHPIPVRQALSKLNLDIQTIRIESREQLSAADAFERQSHWHLMEAASNDALLQFDVIYKLYLGPKSDIDAAINAFMIWNKAREEKTNAALGHKIPGDTLYLKDLSLLREEMLSKVNVIERFATNKANQLKLKTRFLSQQLIISISITLGLVLLISLLLINALIKNINNPIGLLLEATADFQNGNLQARCHYGSRNEFGKLAGSFNKMAETVEINSQLNTSAALIINQMITAKNESKICQTMLGALIKETHSQMGAFYLYNEQETSYKLSCSIGLNDSVLQTFSAENPEGIAGMAFHQMKPVLVCNIPEDVNFTFYTAGGTFKPKEMVTIPVISDKKVIAFILLATIKTYDFWVVRLLEMLQETFNARIERMIATHKIAEFTQMLEAQNEALEQQKSELTEQSAMLTEQNTELEQQKEQLSQASQLKTIFLSNMSHELRTPLNSVIALSGVLNRRLLKQIPDEEYSYLEVIERNSKHLLDLINDILDIARIESGREDIERTSFSLSGLMKELTAILNPQANEKGLKLEITCPDNLILTSDQKKVRHILQNLMGNAIKFTESGKIEVNVAKSKEGVRITVADSGIGIDKDQFDLIFDEFRQADNSISRKYGGTGLGLAIAKKYATMLGGTIGVTSKKGEGSIFNLFLPSSKGPVANTQVVEPVEVSQTSGRKPSNQFKTILIVDDNEPAIIQLTDMLSEYGFNIIVARNGLEAIAETEKSTPDAILLDLMMPEMDGFTVLKTIRENDRSKAVPVLILSAKHITREELNFLRENHVYQTVQKGAIDKRSLLTVVQSLIDGVPTVPSIIGEVSQKLIKRTKNIQPLSKNTSVKPVVMVVEDNPDNMTTVRALLSDHYSLIEAVDGIKALSLAKKHLPDLILMDIALPGISGIETFNLIRNDVKLSHVPVIALTASAMVHDRESILAHGFDGYISKPIDEQTFFRTINEILYG